MSQSIFFERYMDIIGQFMDSKIDASIFTSQFFDLSKEDKDATLNAQGHWLTPIEREWMQSWKRGELSKEEFKRRVEDRPDYKESLPFRDLVASIFTTCDVFREKPDSDWQLDAMGLKSYVATILEEYRTANREE